MTDSLIEFLRSAIADTRRAFAENASAQYKQIDAVDRFLIQTIPVYLEHSLGKDEREKFENAVASAKAKAPKDLFSGYHAAIIYLELFIRKRIKSLSESQSARQKV
jgi:hypothetical protein